MYFQSVPLCSLVIILESQVISLPLLMQQQQRETKKKKLKNKSKKQLDELKLNVQRLMMMSLIIFQCAYYNDITFDSQMVKVNFFMYTSICLSLLSKKKKKPQKLTKWKWNLEKKKKKGKGNIDLIEREYPETEEHFLWPRRNNISFFFLWQKNNLSTSENCFGFFF